MNTIGIHQPNFFPWLGYFAKIHKSDKFIFLDDVQFPKKGGSYVNRTEILTQGKRQWLTVEISRPHGTWNINECIFSNQNWKKKVNSTILMNYTKSDYFKEISTFISELINFPCQNLSELNINAIVKISEALSFNKTFIKSSDFNLQSQSTDRLIELIKLNKGDTYLSGKGGDNYQDKELYKANNINIIYNNFSSEPYLQKGVAHFEAGLSILDVLFNNGFDNTKKMFLK